MTRGERIQNAKKKANPNAFLRFALVYYANNKDWFWSQFYRLHPEFAPPQIHLKSRRCKTRWFK